MIISDSCRLAFIHIPKCAGTTVRSALESLDERYAVMTRGLEPHPERPFTFRPASDAPFADFHHLTLRQLEKWFPEELVRLASCRTYALIRDPHERLFSSITQRLKQFGGVAVQDMTPSALAEALEQALGKVADLLAKDADLPFDYVHFQPQADYIELGGRILVEHVYPTAQIARMQADMAAHLATFGVHLAPFHLSRQNSSKTHRFAVLHRLVARHERGSRLVKKLLPVAAKRGLRAIVYRDRGSLAGGFEPPPEVRAFVKKYYARDLELFARCSRDGQITASVG